MNRLLDYLRSYRDRQHVRPWALATPIAILLICLPLLRPLRYPDPFLVSDSEMARLATIEAIVEQRTLAIDATQYARTRDVILIDNQRYSNQMPVMAVLLAGPYWVMYQMGLTFDSHAVLVPYLLTLLGVTLPVAAGVGLVYRMGRLFELRRPWRAGLAMAVALGSGIISYAVVLNAYAPAGALVLAAAACLVHIVIGKHPNQSGGWLAIAGFCAALAAVVEVSAGIFALLLIGVILAMRWPISLRVGGVLLYLIGCTPPLVLHAVLTVPLTGDLRPGYMHPQLALVPPPPVLVDPTAEELLAPQASRLVAGAAAVGRFFDMLLGRHGLLSHFPVLILGMAGIAAVMHRHWPAAAKVLASATLAGALGIILWRLAGGAVREPGMFAVPWYVIFLPLMLFWIGAWLRRAHHPAAWSVAGLLLAFSTIVSILGATGPHLHGVSNEYTALAAAKRLVQVEQAEPPAIFAGGG